VTRPLRHGQPWGQPAAGPPDLEVAGDDADLAEAAARHPDVLVHFRPSPASDMARALGLSPDATGTTEVALDVLALHGLREGEAMTAVNAVVVGWPPDRLRGTARSASITVIVDGRTWYEGTATTVVVASGQFLRGADLVPRGHPGDGWAEVQVYALTPRERRAMRHRLTTGTHVPHPSIHTARARTVEIEAAAKPLPVEVDGHDRARVRRLGVTLAPAAIRILV
jgi:YegS C-terminal NAD kinase beta sandwich-like domain